MDIRQIVILEGVKVNPHDPNVCMKNHGNRPSDTLDAKYICNKGLPFCNGYSKSDSGVEVYGKCELGGISP